MKPDYQRPLDIKRGRVDMNHGAGGRASAQLIAELFARAFDNELLAQGNDGTVLPLPPPGQRLVVSTDTHVIAPLFFPGGDIGSLAVHGTVNDVAMMGARPVALTAGFVLEEGFALAELKRIADSMAAAARAAGVAIVAGDTKVVERGKGDGVFVTTTGIGYRPEGREVGGANARAGDAVLVSGVGGANARAGDAVLVSGTLGDHGVAVLSRRESLAFETEAFETEILSDSAALNGLVEALFAALPAPAVHVLRDPTRGGLATTVNEIAQQSGVGIVLDEAALPVREQVAGACELLGLDPLYVANEGKLVAVVDAAQADAALAALRAHPLGREAARVGEVVADAHRFVQMRTRFGGRRMVDWLNGEQLPRIC